MNIYARGWKKLSHLGTQHARSFTETKSIILTNKVSFFVSVMGLGIALQYFMGGLYAAVEIQIISVVFFALPLLLNYYGKIFLSKVLLIISCNVNLFFTASLLGYESGEHYAYFALIMAPFLFFEKEGKLVIWFFASLPIFGLIMLEMTNYELLAIPEATSEIQQRDYLVTVTATVLIIIVTVNYFKNLSHKHVQNIVEEAQEELKAIFDNSYDAIFVVDPKTYRILDCNQRAVSFFDAGSKYAMLWKSIFSLQIPDQSGNKPQEAIRELEATKRYIAEKEYLTFKGKQFWGNLAITSVNLEDKNFLLARITDVTIIKKAEAETRNALDELRQRNHELDSFVYSTSHDLRAPIASMLGLVDIAKNEEDLEIIHRYLALIEESSERLDKVIQTILDYSKSVNVNMDFSIIDFQQILDTCIHDLKYMPNAERINFQIDVKQQVSFVSDSFRINTILKNLASNAIKYQNVRANKSFLKFIIRVTEKEAVIDVSDNGIGIKENHIEKIFDMFYRGTEASTGSGLGLYITKLNITKLQGSVKLETKYGEGTRFVISLPNHPIYEDVQRVSAPIQS